MPTVLIFSSSERLGDFLSSEYFQKKNLSQKVISNKQINEKIKKCLIIKWNISGFLLLPAPKKLRILIFLSPYFFIRETLIWRVFLGANHRYCADYRCSRAANCCWKTVSWEISLFLISVSSFALRQTVRSVMPWKAKYFSTRIDMGMRIPSYLQHFAPCKQGNQLFFLWDCSSVFSESLHRAKLS